MENELNLSWRDLSDEFGGRNLAGFRKDYVSVLCESNSLKFKKKGSLDSLREP